MMRSDDTETDRTVTDEIGITTPQPGAAEAGPRAAASAGLTAGELAELEGLLLERGRGDSAEAERLAEELGALLASRSEATADDEHDPEGPTLSSEWSRLQALRDVRAEDRTAVDEALDRLRSGLYGVCVRCGDPIGVDRLRARPTAELCIRCARAADG